MFRDSHSRKANHTDRAIACVIALLLVLAYVRPDFLLAWTPDCLVTHLFHRACWGCGMTHAILALMHGQFSAVSQYNSLAWLVFPLLCWIYLKYVWSALSPA